MTWKNQCLFKSRVDYFTGKVCYDEDQKGTLKKLNISKRKNKRKNTNKITT